MKSRTDQTAVLHTGVESANVNSPGNAAFFWAGLLLCAIATAATLLLVLERVADMPLPGCTGGAESPCARASASQWGKLPGLDWPVSFVGFAFFSGVLVAWIVARGATRGWFQKVLEAGALVSTFYLLLILFGGYTCKYCIAAHTTNLLLCSLTEFRSRKFSPPRNPLPVLAGVFVLASIGVGIADYARRQQIGHQGDIASDESVRKILAQPPATATAPATTTRPNAVSELPIQTTRPAQPTSSTQTAAPHSEKPFTGRYRIGPEKAAIRLVVFSDFQCPDCKAIEAEIDTLLAKYPDKISFSGKHFPFCKDCNPHVDHTIHGNACWAARAAETAGILRGNEGFWQMYRWLFANGGSFTDQSFPPALQSLGYEPNEFIRAMSSDQTLQLVRGDIEEAVALGMYMTPMIFINGVELKGWREQLVRDQKSPLPAQIEKLIAANLPPAGPENDHPPTAADSMVSEWREQAARSIPQPARSLARGAADAKVRVVIFGDYQEPGCAKADETMRRLQSQRTDMSYTFRLFPFNQECNAGLQQTKFPGACLAAKAALAAADLGGADAFWQMHEWLFAHQSGLTEPGIIAAAVAQGLDEARFRERMAAPEVAAALKADEDAARATGLIGIPHIFVNEKYVPRWFSAGPIVLEKIVAEAGEK